VGRVSPLSAQPPPAYVVYDARRACITLTVHVQPGAKTSAFAGQHGDALKIRIAAPAVDNKANAALIRFLAETFGVPAPRLSIRHGGKGRRKVIDIAGASEALAARLPALAGITP
jgi:uncharacterized protein